MPEDGMSYTKLTIYPRISNLFNAASIYLYAYSDNYCYACTISPPVRIPAAYLIDELHAVRNIKLKRRSTCS